MDNQQSFEQQFVQNVKTTPLPAPLPDKPSKSFPIIPVVLSIVIVLQSILLIVLLSNHFAMFNDTDEGESSDETTEGAEEETPYVYNENDELIAMEAECIADNKSSFILTKGNNFEEYDASAALIDSGTYAITRDSVFTFKKSSGNRTLFYDGYTLTDGTDFYECEKAANGEDTGE